MQSLTVMLLSFTLCAFAILFTETAADPSQRKHEHRLPTASSSEPLHRSSVTAAPAASSHLPQPQQPQPPIGFGSMFTQFLSPPPDQRQQHRQQSAAAAVPPVTGPSLSSSISSPEGRLLAEMPTAYCAPYGGSICKKYITPTSFVYYNLTTVRMGRMHSVRITPFVPSWTTSNSCYLILIVHLSSLAPHH